MANFAEIKDVVVRVEIAPGSELQDITDMDNLWDMVNLKLNNSLLAGECALIRISKEGGLPILLWIKIVKYTHMSQTISYLLEMFNGYVEDENVNGS